jgi:ferrous iron transport protein B
MSAHCAPEPGGTVLAADAPRVALVGNPNSGKTSLFNGLTGLQAKTGNYPGVTVARYVGTCRVGAARYQVEDLPGTHSLVPMSPDEQVVTDVLQGKVHGIDRPDALAVVVDATTAHRSLRFLAQVLAIGLPTCLVVSFTDELVRRQGRLDVEALGRAVGVPAVSVVAGRGAGVAALREELTRWREWTRPPVAPPVDPLELQDWVESVLAAASYRPPQPDRRTARIDSLLLHPLWGTLVFFAVMVAFFQTVFTVAAPIQGWIESAFVWLAEGVHAHVSPDWLAALLGDAVIGGVGAVLVFVPQIVLLYLLLALLEGSGYLARAAFLMDRVMARFGLEGRAFVALLSSFACAVPGVMATRTLPTHRTRIATMMGAPLMTCSARLPVYVMLIGMFVSADATIGPLGARGVIMFGLYVLGAVSAMLTAALFARIADWGGPSAPFYMEMPTYRLPGLRAVVISVWTAAGAFLRKCSTIILGTTVVLWLLLNLPNPSDAELAAAGVDLADDAAVAAYTIEESYAADLGRAVAPIFEPLGFDWQINVGVLSSLAARESFVATMGQVGAVEAQAEGTSDTAQPATPPIDAPTTAALLVFFAYALQCMATVAAIRRETGTWRWALGAWVYMFALAWVAALAARHIVLALQ